MMVIVQDFFILVNPSVQMNALQGPPLQREERIDFVISLKESLARALEHFFEVAGSCGSFDVRDFDIALDSMAPVFKVKESMSKIG